MTKRAVGMFIVINSRGLHTRPSTELVRCSAIFRSDMLLICDGVEVNAKSLIGILMLGIPYGTKIIVEAVGEDAEEAVRAMVELANNKFLTKY
jgi:phosphocarrier protein HPr